MRASEQSTELEINGVRMYLNLWSSEEDGAWHFFTTYPSGLTNQQRQWIAQKTGGPLLHSEYTSEQAAKDAVSLLVKNLEANWNGWGGGHSGMPDGYIGPRRTTR